jgi:penicillin-binding protein A
VWAQVAEGVGQRTMAKYMERFGFYARPPLDYPAGQRYVSGVFTSSGLTPVTSNQVDIGRVGIGQGGLLATPLQMAMVAGAVANKGELVKPHLTDRIVDPDGRVTDDIGTTKYHRVMSGDTAAKLTQMMTQVVKEGTGTAAALSGIELAGKTGTAEVENGATNQVWFIGFAPVSDPKIAIAATVERSDGFGGTVAGPIAKQVLETLLNQ